MQCAFVEINYFSLGSPKCKVWEQGGFEGRYHCLNVFAKAIEDDPTVLHKFLESWMLSAHISKTSVFDYTTYESIQNLSHLGHQDQHCEHEDRRP